jgi:hypothetical protein
LPRETPDAARGHASTAVVPAPDLNSTGAPKLVHFEHPERPGEAWCGAPVTERSANPDADCVVCQDLLSSLCQEIEHDL